MDEMQMTKIVTQFSRQGNAPAGEIKITRIQDSKSVYVETIGESGRPIDMAEYKVDGKTYWAGFSTRSQTVYVSCR
jgi:hypothetical protein